MLERVKEKLWIFSYIKSEEDNFFKKKIEMNPKFSWFLSEKNETAHFQLCSIGYADQNPWNRLEYDDDVLKMSRHQTAWHHKFFMVATQKLICRDAIVDKVSFKIF